MLDETEDVIELNEARLRQLYADLARYEPTDPNYKKIADNIEVLSRVLDSHQQVELKRIDNNMKNDIEEQKLVIEMEKVEADKARSRGDWFWKFMYGGIIYLYGAVIVSKFLSLTFCIVFSLFLTM